MELSTVISTFKQLDAEKFYCSFTRLFELSFRIDDLMFWCEVTGINEKSAWSTLQAHGWKLLSREIYVYGTIETIVELEELCSVYGLQKKDIISAVIEVVNMCKWYLPKALKEIPLSYKVVYILLELQDELIPLNCNNWMPKSALPDQVKVISRYAHSLQRPWDESIISTFVKSGRPLKIEELIYQSMAIVPATVGLKRMFTFMLNLLPVIKIDDTEFWILKKWEHQVDLKLVDRITNLLNESGTLPVNEIVKELKGYEVAEIIKILEFWPEFKGHSNDTFGMNISPLDDELLGIIVPSLLKYLAEAREGIPITQLFKHAEMIANSHGLNMHTRDFKPFLKSWGEVAIVGGYVYAMQHAPFHRMRLGDVAYLVLKENGSPMPYTELEAQIRRRRNYNNSISSVFLTEPKLSRPSRGYWALREWGLIEYDPQIHNRIGDILISIIETAGRPVHKSEMRRQLRRRGMNMNEGTLHLDLTDNERIHQVARGVYALTEWKLSFRDLFRFKFPFRLSLPDGNPTIYELENGVMVEYFISKHCLELGRILIKRYIIEHFPALQQYTKYTVMDIAGARYEGWVDRLDEGRYQILGLQRWYKSHKPKYGENIYLYIPSKGEYTFSLLTADQADVWMYESSESGHKA
ncbi:hypothetical protein [Paenibacillus sp. FSL P2-0136]|uniref:hypothetical protein n=1 Tax=unclassified Paenibacillus TaxID=185978 RepID=UPI0030DA9371